MSSEKNINHEERAHAVCSASGAAQWMACTPSVRLEEQFDEVESDHAKEGTLAHEFAELGLRMATKQLTGLEYSKQLNELRKSEFYTKEMEGQVQKYVDYVMDRFNAAKKADKHAKLLIEERFDFSQFVEDGFGTGDATIVYSGKGEGIDLKYGMGLMVHAQNNPQLKLYAMGALNAYEMEYGIEEFTMTIVQPRLDHISESTEPVEDLYDWAEKEVAPRAQLAFAGEGELVSGDHCRFCKAMPRCKRVIQDGLDAWKAAESDEFLATDEELIHALETLPRIKKWMDKAGAYMLRVAESGHKFEGYKVVAGHPRRKWISDDKVIAKLKTMRVKQDEYLNVKLGGIAQVSNLMSKDRFEKNVLPLIAAPNGKPALVKDADSRPALGKETAFAAFEDENDTE